MDLDGSKEDVTFDLEKVVFNTFVTQSCGIPGTTFNPFYLKFLKLRQKSLFWL